MKIFLCIFKNKRIQNANKMTCAVELGLPSSVLHQYISGRLIPKKSSRYTLSEESISLPILILLITLIQPVGQCIAVEQKERFVHHFVPLLQPLQLGEVAAVDASGFDLAG